MLALWALALLVPLHALADRTVKQLQFGKQVITVAGDETIIFTDPLGEVNYTGQKSENAQSLTVFKPAVEGYSVQITFESINMGGTNNYLSSVNVYNGDPDPGNTFQWATKTADVSSSTTLPTGNYLRQYPNERNRTYNNETYYSTSADGMLSVGFVYYYAYSCTGWTAKVHLVKLTDMNIKSAGGSTEGIVEKPKTQLNVPFAAIKVATEGVLHPDTITSLRFRLGWNEGAVDPRDLKLYDGNGNNLNATPSTIEDELTMTLSYPLSEGNNMFYLRGDFLGTAPIGTQVVATPIGATTKAYPNGIPGFQTIVPVNVRKPAVVIMGTQPQTIVVDDNQLAFYDEGGIDGKIKQNVNGLVTFVPKNEGKKVMVDFTKISIWHGTYYNQEIRVYNGSETTEANLLRTFQDGDEGFVHSTAPDGSLTIMLFSDSQAETSENDGFEAIVREFTPEAMQLISVEPQTVSDETLAAGSSEPMLHVGVTTENTEPALTPSKVVVDLGESSAYVSKVKIYSTASSSEFNPDNASLKLLIGEADVQGSRVTVATPNALPMLEGKNHLWVAYDIALSAPNSTKITAQLESVVFGDTLTSEYNGSVKAERTIKNTAIATEGSKSVTVYGSYNLASEQYASNKLYTAPGTNDRIVTFMPGNQGNVCQINFSKFDLYYSSTDYGTRCKFEVYNGSGTQGEKLWSLQSADDRTKGPQAVLRSKAEDGAITIVYNPNTSSYYYCGEGFEATVEEYTLVPMTVDTIVVAQTSTDAVQAGTNGAELLTINIATKGTLSPKTLSAIKVNLNGTHQNISNVMLFSTGSADETPGVNDVPVALATAAEGDVTLTFDSPHTLTEGNNFFRLVANVKSSAPAESTIDASIKSATIDGASVTVPDGNPEGSRTVKLLYLIKSGTNGQVTVGDNTLMFYDDGGALHNASRSFSGTVTFVPAGNDKAVKLNFKSVSIGAYSDKIEIYSGNDVKTKSDLEIGYYNSAPDHFASKASDGSVTVKFTTGTSATVVTNFAIEVLTYDKQPLAVDSVGATNLSPGETLRGGEDVVLQRIAVRVKGDKDVVALSKFSLAATETSATQRYKIYATGTSDNFTATNHIGQSESTEIPVNYTISNEGTYYFWLTTDIKSDAVPGSKTTLNVVSVTANSNTIATTNAPQSTIEVVAGKSGTIEVGPETDYPTIQSAINSLSVGIEGPVVLKVKAGTYNERLTIPFIKGASSTNTITICGDEGKRKNVHIYHDSYSKPAYGETGYGVVTLDSARYVTLRNLCISTTDATYEAVVYVRNVCQHVTIDSCYLTAPTTTSYQEDINIIGHNVPSDGDNKNNDYLVVTNNVIEGGYIGINMGGTNYVARPKEIGGVIENNIVRAQGSKAIYVMDELGAKIRGNKVYNTSATGSNFYGIDIQVRDEYAVSTEIVGNTFFIANSNTAGGMYLRKLTGTANAPVVIQGNEVRVVSQYAATFGVKFSDATCRNVDFNHNSIRVTSVQNPVSTGSNAMWFSSTLTDAFNIRVTDNIIQTEADGYAINLYNNGNLGQINFSNNVWFTTGDKFARASSSNEMDFDEWTANSGETGGAHAQTSFLDYYRLFPSAETGNRGVYPYSASRQPATYALGDPLHDEEFGSAEPEPSTPAVTATAKQVETPIAEQTTLTALLAEGTAPYTVVWFSTKRDTLKSETLADANQSLTLNIVPDQCADYVVKVIDANLKEASDTIRVIATGDAVTATFENHWLGVSGFDNAATESGDDAHTTLVDGSFSFSMNNEYSGMYWYGFALSNHTSTTFATLTTDQYNSVAGSGVDGSDNYLVCYSSEYSAAPRIDVLSSPLGTQLRGVYVTNSAYAVKAMTDGLNPASPFTQGSWLKATFTADNGRHVDYYLADYRSSNIADHYILDSWDWVDLSSLGTVKWLTITMSGSDSGNFGLNTPAYFCLDNFNAPSPSANAIHPTVVGEAGSADAVFDLSGRRHSSLQRGVNIVRMNDGTVRKVVVK